MALCLKQFGAGMRRHFALNMDLALILFCSL